MSLDLAKPDAMALAGLSGWVISDGKAGSESQAIGIADALGLVWRLIQVAPGPPYKWLAPFGPPDPRDRFGEAGSEFAKPFPAVAIAIGRRTMPYLRAVKRVNPETKTIALLDSKAGLGVADVIWVPEHDRLRGPNVVTSLTAPHGFSLARLADLRSRPPPDISALPGPRLTVLLGGRNAVYRYTDADHRTFAENLGALAGLSGSVMLTPSRRTHPDLLSAALDATAERPRLVFDGVGENPYPAMLANGDAIVVTADSISMTAEAAATGRPVLVMHPSKGSRKFARFHASLEHRGIARRLDRPLATFPVWHYAPIDATAEIAREIARRLAA